MGFNNHGAAAGARHLAATPALGIVGGNIGKTRIVEEEDAAQDHAASARWLARTCAIWW